MIFSPVFNIVVRKFLLALAFIYSGEGYSSEKFTLPEPLTLEYALTLSTNLNPDIAFNLAERDLLNSEKFRTAAESGFKLSLEGRLEWVERTNARFAYNVDEQKLSLKLSKSLYDFGEAYYKLTASDKLLDNNKLIHQHKIFSRQVKIMEAYFDVLLSDLRFHRNNENMAISFISWDDSRKRNELGLVSDLGVEKKFSEYQRVRRLRFESENNQRQTRNRLAVLMYSNGQLPSTLASPNKFDRINKYPAIDELVKKAFNNNLELRAIHATIDSVRNSIRAVKSQTKPQFKFESNATTYANDFSVNTFSRENWNVGIVMAMPIMDSGDIDSQVASIRAEIYRLETLAIQKKASIQHEILTLKLKLDTLRFERDEANAFNGYSELFLDEKRALYEMEVNSTLGSAMVQISDAQYGVAKSLYDTLLTWAKIDVLVGDEPAAMMFIK